jgi:hypothetical protein
MDVTFAVKGDPGTGVSCPVDSAEKAFIATLLPLGLLTT